MKNENRSPAYRLPRSLARVALALALVGTTAPVTVRADAPAELTDHEDAAPSSSGIVDGYYTGHFNRYQTAHILVQRTTTGGIALMYGVNAAKATYGAVFVITELGDGDQSWTQLFRDGSSSLSAPTDANRKKQNTYKVSVHQGGNSLVFGPTKFGRHIGCADTFTANRARGWSQGEITGESRYQMRDDHAQQGFVTRKKLNGSLRIEGKNMGSDLIASPLEGSRVHLLRERDLDSEEEDGHSFDKEPIAFITAINNGKSRKFFVTRPTHVNELSATANHCLAPTTILEVR